MLHSFQITTPKQIRFGIGVLRDLPQVLPKTSGAILLVRGASERHAKPLKADLDTAGYSVVESVAPGEPSITSVNDAFETLKPQAIAAVVACGGGSVLDTAKALRFCLEVQSPLPSDFADLSDALLSAPSALMLVAIPTTAGTGAEVTSNAVLETATSKVSLRGRRLFPDVALVDPALLMSAPKSVAIGAGLDAVTQTMEAHSSRLATPYTTALTAPNLPLGVQALRAVVERGDPSDWSQIAWVSLSSGLALANGGLGAAHGLAAVLGTRLKAPHGLLCGRLLGPVLLKNRAVTDLQSDTYRRIDACIDALAEVFAPQSDGHDLSGFDAWLQVHDVPCLRDFSLKSADFGEVAKASATASSSTKNAVSLEVADFVDILEAAY